MENQRNETAWIGLGSNLGDGVANLQSAARELITLPGHELLKSSSIYKTEPVGEGYGDDFYNAVISMRTPLPPRELLKVCLRIEAELGRDRVASSDRAIDLDILFYGDVILSDPFLILPHPRIADRRFVLEPLVEIASKLIHPVFQVTVSELLKNLGKGQRVEKLDVKAVN